MEKLGNYFNSELNKYIGENLPRIMTSIDLDLFQVKLSRKIIRFAEYKHIGESMGEQQEKALKQLAKMADVINKNKELFDGWTMQVMIIRGNIPYDYIEITDLIMGKFYKVSVKDKINKFLMLEK